MNKSTWSSDAATLLHSMEYYQTKEDIIGYRGARREYMAKHFITISDWHKFIKVEQNAAKSEHAKSLFNQSFIHNYLKSFVLQAARETGLLDFWLLYLELANNDVDACLLALDEAASDTFDAHQLIPIILQLLKPTIKYKEALSRVSLLMASVPMVQLSELMSEIQSKLAVNVSTFEKFKQLSEQLMSQLQPIWQSLEAGTGTDDNDNGMIFEQIDRVFNLYSGSSMDCEVLRHNFCISVLRRMLRLPQYERSASLWFRLMLELSTSSAPGIPQIEAMARRAANLCHGYAELKMACFKVLLINQGKVKYQEQLLMLKSYLRDLVPTDDGLSLEEIADCHLFFFRLMCTESNDEIINKVFQTLKRNFEEFCGGDRKYRLHIAKLKMFLGLGSSRAKEELGHYIDLIRADPTNEHLLKQLIVIPVGMWSDDILEVVERALLNHPDPAVASDVLNYIWEHLLLFNDFNGHMERMLKMKFALKTAKVSTSSQLPHAKRARIEEPSIPETSEDTSDRKVFLSNIAFKASEEELLSFLQHRIPLCRSVELIRDTQGRSKGIGHALFSTVEAAHHALQLDRTAFAGRPLFISRHQAVPRSERQRVVKEERDPRVLFLSHLPSTITKEDLMRLFSLDDASRIRLVADKHLAYVEFDDEQEAAAALGLDGSIIGDTPIRVQVSDPAAARAKAASLKFTPRNVKPKSRVSLH